MHNVRAPLPDRQSLLAIVRYHPTRLLLKKHITHPVSAIAILALGKFPQPNHQPNQLFLPNQKVQFSMANLMLLVTVATAGMGIFTTFPIPIAAVWYYTLLALGIPSFICASEDWDFWLPSVMNSLLIAWIPTQQFSTNNSFLAFFKFGCNPWFLCYSALCALVLIPLLMVSFWQRQTQNNFSYALFVYQLTSTLPGMYLVFVLFVFSALSLLSSIFSFLTF